MIKIKKLIVLLMAVFVCASSAACQRDSSNDGAVKDPPDNAQNNSGLSGSDKPENSDDSAPSLKDIRDTVVEAYGESYRADNEMDADYVSAEFGINRDYIEDAYGEYSDDPDCNHMFLSIKAKKGFGENVETQLREYFDSHKGESSSEADKYREDSAQLYRSGDYVFYVRLGEDADTAVDNVEDMADYAKDQVKIGIDKIKSFFE